MAATPDELFARLDALGIRHVTHHHPPLHTVAQSVMLRKGGLWLVVVLEHRRLDLNALSARLGAPRFSFGSPELLQGVLGVTPGSVTPFALVNDRERRVAVVLDADMLEHAPLNYHPLVNTATSAVAPADLLRFIAACGHQPRIVALGDIDRAPAP